MHRSENPMSWHSTLWRNVFVRLGVYYASLVIAAVILFRAFPIIPEYMDAERARHVRTATGFLGPDDVDIPGFAVGPGALLQMSLVIPITLSMAFAFALSLPIAWLYTWTRQGKTYRPSLAQTLVILPIAISLVVFPGKGQPPPCVQPCRDRRSGSVPLLAERTYRRDIHVRGHRCGSRYRCPALTGSHHRFVVLRGCGAHGPAHERRGRSAPARGMAASARRCDEWIP